MKKLVLTLAITFMIGLNAFAQYDEDKFGMQPWFGTSLLGKESSADRTGGDDDPMTFPGGHGLYSDADAPLGSGIAVLLGLGTAYLMGKKRIKNKQ